MSKTPLRLLATALVSGALLAGGMAVPASAQSMNWGGPGYYRVSDHGGYYRGERHFKKFKRRGDYRKFRRHRDFRFRRHRHRDRNADFVIGLGLGFLGSAIASQHYHSYNSFCHVHRYPVRGMTFHSDVRCFQHSNWNSPSIVYVR